MAAVRPPTFARFCLEDDADGLWVAEDVGEIVGFAFSWVLRRPVVARPAFCLAGSTGMRRRPALLDVIANDRSWHLFSVPSKSTARPPMGVDQPCRSADDSSARSGCLLKGLTLLEEAVLRHGVETTIGALCPPQGKQ
jgi:hypothetical protein